MQTKQETSNVINRTITASIKIIHINLTLSSIESDKTNRT
jgi:hypothetical protein